VKRDTFSLIEVVKRSCQIKAGIVEIDEKEGSVRAFLNYGHTFGHAIEALTDYGQWKHGEAVAIGMVVAAKIAQSQGLCSSEDVTKIVELLQLFNLPVSPPDFALTDYVVAMLRDKKVNDGTLTLILNQGIGSVIAKKIPNVESVFTPILNP
ncbi:MAG TPA: 3-dehydroquinate synthase, partial [Malonomonas sp.]